MNNLLFKPEDRIVVHASARTEDARLPMRKPCRILETLTAETALRPHAPALAPSKDHCALQL